MVVTPAKAKDIRSDYSGLEGILRWHKEKDEIKDKKKKSKKRPLKTDAKIITPPAEQQSGGGSMSDMLDALSPYQKAKEFPDYWKQPLPSLQGLLSSDSPKHLPWANPNMRDAAGGGRGQRSSRGGTGSQGGKGGKAHTPEERAALRKESIIRKFEDAAGIQRESNIATPESSAIKNSEGKVISTFSTNMTPEERAFLDTLAIGGDIEGEGFWESPDYNTIVDGAKFEDFSDHPRQFGTQNKDSTAAGRYQITMTTWDEYVKKWNKEHPDDPVTDFSPANQDKIAMEIAKDRYKKYTGRDLGEDLKNPPENFGEHLKKLGPTWEILQKRDAETIGSAFNSNLERNKGYAEEQARREKEEKEGKNKTPGDSIGDGKAETYDPNLFKNLTPEEREQIPKEILDIYENPKATEREKKAIASVYAQKGIDGIKEITGELPQPEGYNLGPTMDGGFVSEDTPNVVERQSGTRNMPIAGDVRTGLSYAAEKTGVEVEVVSGGQPTKEQGGPRVGTERHDLGNAADIKLYRRDENGNKVYITHDNPEGAAIWKEFYNRAEAAGLQGLGAGQGYMGSDMGHVGKGERAVWGATESYDSAAPWLKDNFAEGVTEEEAADYSQWKEKKEKERELAEAKPAEQTDKAESDSITTETPVDIAEPLPNTGQNLATMDPELSEAISEDIAEKRQKDDIVDGTMERTDDAPTTGTLYDDDEAPSGSSATGIDNRTAEEINQMFPEEANDPRTPNQILIDAGTKATTNYVQKAVEKGDKFNILTPDFTGMTPKEIEYYNREFGWREEGIKNTDPKLMDIMKRAAQTLPDGYQVHVYAGQMPHKEVGKDENGFTIKEPLGPGEDWAHHGSDAVDLIITDPSGNPIPNHSELNPESVLYEKLYRAADMYKEELYPGLPFAWGRNSTASTASLQNDIMHYQLADNTEESKAATQDWINKHQAYSMEEGNTSELFPDYDMTKEERDAYDASVKAKIEQDRAAGNLVPIVTDTKPETPETVPVPENVPSTEEEIPENVDGLPDWYDPNTGDVKPGFVQTLPDTTPTTPASPEVIQTVPDTSKSESIPDNAVQTLPDTTEESDTGLPDWYDPNTGGVKPEYTQTLPDTTAAEPIPEDAVQNIPNITSNQGRYTTPIQPDNGEDRGPSKDDDVRSKAEINDILENPPTPPAIVAPMPRAKPQEEEDPNRPVTEEDLRKMAEPPENIKELYENVPEPPTQAERNFMKPSGPSENQDRYSTPVVPNNALPETAEKDTRTTKEIDALLEKGKEEPPVQTLPDTTGPVENPEDLVQNVPNESVVDYAKRTEPDYTKELYENVPQPPTQAEKNFMKPSGPSPNQDRYSTPVVPNNTLPETAEKDKRTNKEIDALLEAGPGENQLTPEQIAEATKAYEEREAKRKAKEEGNRPVTDEDLRKMAEPSPEIKKLYENMPEPPTQAERNFMKPSGPSPNQDRYSTPVVPDNVLPETLEKDKRSNAEIDALLEAGPVEKQLTPEELAEATKRYEEIQNKRKPQTDSNESIVDVLKKEEETKRKAEEEARKAGLYQEFDGMQERLREQYPEPRVLTPEEQEKRHPPSYTREQLDEMFTDGSLEKEVDVMPESQHKQANGEYMPINPNATEKSAAIEDKPKVTPDDLNVAVQPEPEPPPSATQPPIPNNTQQNSMSSQGSMAAAGVSSRSAFGNPDLEDITNLVHEYSPSAARAFARATNYNDSNSAKHFDHGATNTRTV
jgi:muramidase (phage lysozyme)